MVLVRCPLGPGLSNDQERDQAECQIDGDTSQENDLLCWTLVFVGEKRNKSLRKFKKMKLNYMILSV